MQKIVLATLDLSRPLPAPLYHEAGWEVFAAGEVPFLGDLIALQRLRVAHLLQFDSRAAAGAALEELRVLRLPIDQVLPSHVLAADLYDDDGHMLVGRGRALDLKTRQDLKQRGVAELTVARDFPELPALTQFLQEKRARRDQTDESFRPIVLPRERVIDDPEQLSESRIRAESFAAALAPQGEPLHNVIKHDAPLTRPEELKRFYVSLYAKYFDRTRALFDELAEGEGRVDAGQVGAMANDLIQCLIRDKNLLICLHQFKYKNDPLVNHALNVTLIAINVGASLRLDRVQVFELAYAGLLHDVGLLEVPGELLNKAEPLTDEERRVLRAHSVGGLRLLRRMTGLPRSVPISVLHGHEREDGSGYPQGLRGPAIHPFAKVLAIADTYDTLTTDHPWQNGRLPYEAMEELIRSAARGLFDREMVKAFLRYFSLFPIGSWVQLNTQEIAHVIAAHPDRYDRPVVRVVFKNESRETYAHPKIIDLGSHPHCYVQRPVETPRDLFESHFWLMNLL